MKRKGFTRGGQRGGRSPSKRERHEGKREGWGGQRGGRSPSKRERDTRQRERDEEDRGESSEEGGGGVRVKTRV